MYNCKNCGGNLRFDIPSQRLKCPYCDSDYDCYEMEDVNTSSDEDSYDVTVFSCPACGAEIVSSDQSAAEFCSYCGSSVVLDSRLRREKRPQKIIPFKKTSEDCIKAYKAKLKGVVFAPSVLKDARFLENFRGIYVPYWSYGFSHKGPVSLTAKHEYRSGDYDVTDYYRVSGDIDTDYDGICYDASSSFDDNISEAIAPFHPGEMKDFVPSYLSGFYADVEDVPADTYIDDANNIVNEDAIRLVEQDRNAGKYPISRSAGTKTMNEKLSTVIHEPVSAMLPVWFLTWRDKDRVAYMTVNGQTGKVSADIPIDIRKYVVAALVCSVPLYFILNLLFSFTAPTSLFIAGVFALVSGIIYYEEIQSIIKRDTREMDRGYQRTKGIKKRVEMREERTSGSEKTGSVLDKYKKENREKAREQRKQQKQAVKKKKPFSHSLIHIGMIASVGLFLLNIMIYYVANDSLLGAIFNRNTINFLLIAAVFGLWELIIMDDDKKHAAYHPARGIIVSQLMAIVSAVINIIHPVSDIIYYVAMLVVYLGIFATLIQVILKYNLLITRPIPGLHDRGKEAP